MTPSSAEITPAETENFIQRTCRRTRSRSSLCCSILSRRRHSFSMRIFSRGFPRNPSWTLAKSSSDMALNLSESFTNSANV